MLSIGYVTYLGKIKYYKNPSVQQWKFFEKARLSGTDTTSKEHGKFAVAWKVFLVSKWVC